MFKVFILSIGLLFNLNLVNANSITIFGGTYDYDDDNTSNLFGLNYHLEDNNFNLFDILDINPVIGVFVTGKSASMLYSGFETNIGQDKLYLNLSSSAGLYNNGDGKDLGNMLQFKSEVNVFFKISKSSEVGFGSHHISNAGLSSVNPGTNNYYLIFKRGF
ncbi:acyloxyacyl hydrolase [Alphaproteobacteria bacterium]|nr:acyloxyacyl hydrolase [Alphaproteobacteria bacterium]